MMRLLKQAIQLSNEITNISELARELVIKATLLYKWRREYEEFREGSFELEVLIIKDTVEKFAKIQIKWMIL